ncbi:MAG: hypothetical protein PX481_09645 [Microcystis sp. M53603_WE2]|uniref:hypothetical protein n=1 Tax=Microcystis sp. M53603_WE2 TaxID=3030678 RepID=UPI00258FCEBD|nr:hypothetical protein [Microcystis sp. M53603_WE2]MDJ0538945.1 hypothetical protein [Microcystis sp. M53603_WE2]
MRVPHSEDFPVIIGSIILCNSPSGFSLFSPHLTHSAHLRSRSVDSLTSGSLLVAIYLWRP